MAASARVGAVPCSALTGATLSEKLCSEMKPTNPAAASRGASSQCQELAFTKKDNKEGASSVLPFLHPSSQNPMSSPRATATIKKSANIQCTEKLIWKSLTLLRGPPGTIWLKLEHLKKARKAMILASPGKGHTTSEQEAGLSSSATATTPHSFVTRAR